MQRSDGGVGFFQVDVAGHGAPAAMVSVASHQILSQAIPTKPEGMRLEDLVERINGDWPEDLPYFTMILGEIDPRTRRGSIVQVIRTRFSSGAGDPWNRSETAAFP